MMKSSVNNSLVKYYKKLRDKKYILEEKKFIVEGSHLVEEAYKSGVLLSVISTTLVSDYGVPCEVLSEVALKSISLLKSTPNIMGVVKYEEKSEIIGNKIVLLDNVQDPGNVGTIIRCALAFNVTTVILSPDSVNLYNDKMIRSTEGTIFNMNVIKMDLKEAIKKIKEKGIKVYYADMEGSINLDNTKIDDYALVLGSEGQGISKSVASLCDNGIKVPMNSLCESLNVSVCGGIIMYKFR